MERDWKGCHSSNEKTSVDITQMAKEEQKTKNIMLLFIPAFVQHRIFLLYVYVVYIISTTKKLMRKRAKKGKR